MFFNKKKCQSFIQNLTNLIIFFGLNIGCQPENEKKPIKLQLVHNSANGVYEVSLSNDAKNITITFTNCYRQHDLDCIILVTSSIDNPQVFLLNPAFICDDGIPVVNQLDGVRTEIAVPVLTPINTGCTPTAQIAISVSCHDNQDGLEILSLLPYAVGTCA